MTTIVLAEYDPEWPQMFEREAARIRAVLGDRALRIEHTGSTSVPGLSAKPIIDITLAVPDSADEPAYLPSLEAAGFPLKHREPAWYEHRMFTSRDSDVHLHVFSAGCEEIERMVAFRDHLRANLEDRERYERTKHELAQRHWETVQHYADAKTQVVKEILARATRCAALPPD